MICLGSLEFVSVVGYARSLLTYHVQDSHSLVFWAEHSLCTCSI